MQHQCHVDHHSIHHRQYHHWYKPHDYHTFLCFKRLNENALYSSVLVELNVIQMSFRLCLLCNVKRNQKRTGFPHRRFSTPPLVICTACRVTVVGLVVVLLVLYHYHHHLQLLFLHNHGQRLLYLYRHVHRHLLLLSHHPLVLHCVLYHHVLYCHGHHLLLHHYPLVLHLLYRVRQHLRLLLRVHHHHYRHHVCHYRSLSY